MSIRDLLPTFWGNKNVPVRHYGSDNPLQEFSREVNRVFDNFFSGLSPFRERFTNAFPQIDIKETDNDIQIEAELPGLDKDDVKISLSENVLILQGEKKQEKEEKKGTYYHMERSYGSFQRTIPLPEDVDETNVDAMFNNGVLKIHLNKKPEAQRKVKSIPIKT